MTAPSVERCAAGAAVTPPRAARHIPALDGLRGVAILLVLLVHACSVFEDWGTSGRAAFGWIAFGAYGVDLFFVLSGFLITGILLDARNSPTYFRSFYVRRALRLFPLYYSYLALVFFVLPVLNAWIGTRMPSYDGARWWYWTYLSNWKTGGGAQDTHLGHFWSLAVEEQFYLLWSVVVYFAPRKRLPWICGALALAACGLRIAAVTSGASWQTTYRVTPLRLDCLALGGLAATLHRKVWNLPRKWNLGTLTAIAAAGFVVVCFVSGGQEWYRPGVQTIGAFLLALTFALVVLSTVGAPRGPLATLLNRDFLRSCGKYSYGMYVLHMLVFDYLNWIRATAVHRLPAFDAASRLAFPVVAIAVAYGAAWISWRVLEERFLKLKAYFPY